MRIESIFNKILRLMIWIVIVISLLILIYTVAEFIFIVARLFINKTSAFSLSVPVSDYSTLFISHIQKLIAAILLITILIELIKSLFEYLNVGGSEYVTIIIEIALIAVVRHLLSIDFEHINSGNLFGLAFILLVVGAIYLVMKKKIFNKKEAGDNKNIIL